MHWKMQLGKALVNWTILSLKQSNRFRSIREARWNGLPCHSTSSLQEQKAAFGFKENTTLVDLNQTLSVSYTISELKTQD